MPYWWTTRTTTERRAGSRRRIDDKTLQGDNVTTKTKTMVTRMHNPPHPGEVLQGTVLSEGRISVTEFARKLGVSRVALSRVVNGRAAVSAELALRLAAALGGSAESWLRMQAAYDLWQAGEGRRLKVKRLKLPETVKSLQM